MLDTEQANAKIKQLEAELEDYKSMCRETLQKINEENQVTTQKIIEIQEIDKTENEMLSKENDELRQQIEALQTELNQLKNP